MNISAQHIANSQNIPSGVDVARALLARMDERGAIRRGLLVRHTLLEKLLVSRKALKFNPQR
jgi:hypothetical protein